MENTAKPVFNDDSAEFFLPKGEGFQGPFRPSEIHARLLAKELSWVDHCYREKDGVWTRIADHPVFRDLQPSAPTPKPTAVPPPFKGGLPSVKWFIFADEVQSGPFEAVEVKRLIATSQLSGAAFLWNESFSEWKPVGEVDEFREVMPEQKSSGAERRAAPRKPLVAQVYVTNQKNVATAICRDVSVGGMQVLTDVIPGKPGETIRLNVLPPSASGLPAFVAEGVIVRVLEDGKGFSFRFTRISSEAKKAIEEYVA